jgi:5-methylcytosine-specific restriction endonuclease McrA
MTADPYKDPVYQANRVTVLALAEGQCQMTHGCQRRATTVDHVIPLAKGGTHELANLRAACRTCNSRGGMAIVNERRYLARLGRRSRTW